MFSLLIMHKLKDWAVETLIDWQNPLFRYQDEKKKEESLQWLTNAAGQGSCQAAFDLWKMRFCEGPIEPYSRLERLRELRDCATAGHPDAQLTLALEYAKGNLGGVNKTQVAEFISQVHV